MKKMLLIVSLMVFSLVGCVSEAPSSDKVQEKQQEKILQEGTRQIGMPNVTNFFERKMMKKIIELRDNPQLTTYVYNVNRDGQYVFIGRAIGFGLPYSTQFTNPEKRIGDGVEGEIATLPQADPNGLFSSDSTAATWIMLVNEETNEPEIIYAEPEMVVTQTKLPKRLVAEWSLPKNY